jgi:hypothetical protein
MRIVLHIFNIIYKKLKMLPKKSRAQKHEYKKKIYGISNEEA